MSFKPDFGTRLLQDGSSRDEEVVFADFHMFSLSVLGVGSFSTTSNYVYEHEAHAVSLDFGSTELSQILAFAPLRVAIAVSAELARDCESPRDIELSGPVRFGVRTRIGPVQTSRVTKERFVPFIALEILPP